MRGELTRGTLTAILATGAVAFGAGAWLLLGPVWAIAGALLGPLVAVVVVASVRAFTAPDAATLLDNDQPGEAIARLRNEMPSWRALARIWPSQFRDALANRLIVQSGALQAMNRGEEALRTADEAVAIYQDLAAERPGKYGPDLADALAAVHEATEICQDKLPWQQLPSCAARAMLLEGELLCGQSRYREAARLLATGWRMADGQHQQDLLRDATPAIRAAYRADPDHFVTAWRAETGAEPPDWLTT